MIGIRDRNEPNGYKTNSTTQKVDATLSSTSNNPPSNKAVRSAMPFNFGIDEDGNYGYIPIGADSVVPFKKRLYLIKDGVPQVPFEPKAVRCSSDGGTANVPSVTMEDGYIKIAQGNQGSYITANPIDTNGYNTVIAEIMPISNTSAQWNALTLGCASKNTDKLNENLYARSHYGVYAGSTILFNEKKLYLAGITNDITSQLYVALSQGFVTSNLYNLWLEKL